MFADYPDFTVSKLPINYARSFRETLLIRPRAELIRTVLEIDRNLNFYV